MNPFQSDNIWKKKARQGKAQQHPLTPRQEWQKQVNSSSLWLGGGVVLLALYLAAVRAGTVALDASAVVLIVVVGCFCVYTAASLGRLMKNKPEEKAAKINAKWMIPAAVVLGIMISAGEFFCTGQVYLAAILYMMKMQQEMKLQTNAAFIVYVTAMCIPSFLIVLVIEKTKNVISMSNKTFEWLPAIKLVTAIIFFMFAVFMLIQ